MKMTSIAWAGLLTCSILAGGTQGQDLRQPLSVRPVGFNYNNFTEGAAPPATSSNAIISPIVDPVNSAVPTPSVGSVISSQPITSPTLSTQTIGTGTIMHAPAGNPAPVAAPQIYSQAPMAHMPAPMAAAPSCGCAPAAAPCGCDTVSAPACSPCGDCGGGSCLGGCSLGLADCNLGDPWTLCGALHGGDCPPRVNIGGWLSAGYHGESNDLFNSRPNNIALHQGWLYAEKAATTDSPLGFRADIMYGLDADDTQAFGNPPGSWDFDNGLDRGSFGWAIPQLYGEVALTDNWTVKAGHFYTLVGYEVVTAPDNFFYSHAITMYNSEPFTHTGVLATGTISENLTAYAGWTLGWDTGFDQFNGGSSWLGGFSYTLSDSAAFTYISTAGNLGARGDEAYSHSMVLDMSLTDNLNYVVQSDLVRVASTGEDNFGINQYLLYSVSDCLGFGARMEWWKADNITGYAPHGGVLPADGSFSYYAATFGANVRPHANFVLRPEVRIDWSPAVGYDEAYFGVDAIFTF